MLKNNAIPLELRVEMTSKGLDRLIREIALTPIEPGLLKLMNPQVQTSVSAMVKTKQGGNVVLFPVKS